jgi:addiction module HigA family antidote
MTDRLRNPHPGETIREDFLKPWGMSAYRLAQGTGMTRTHVGQILNGKRSITAETALRLSRFLGCTPRFWLGLQAAYDLEEVERNCAAELEQIQRYEHAGDLSYEEIEAPDGELVVA